MTIEKLEKAKQLSEEITSLKKDLNSFAWGISGNVVERKFFVRLDTEVNGAVPKELFRTVSRICYDHIESKIKRLESEFNEL